MKNLAAWECDYCQEKKLDEKRNCTWTQPGVCATCGEIEYEEVYQDPETGQFLCPNCDKVVRFPQGSEFLLGKTFRTPGCPKSKITSRARFFLNLVNWSETTGKLPTSETLFNESLLFFEIRNFIIAEENIAEEEMRPKESPEPARKKGRK